MDASDEQPAWCKYRSMLRRATEHVQAVVKHNGGPSTRFLAMIHPAVKSK